MLRDAYCRTLGIEYMHIQDPEQKRWIQQHVEGVPGHLARRGAAPHPRPAERGRGLRAVPAHPLRGPEALRARGGRVDHRPARHPARRGGHGRHDRGGDGHGPPGPAERAGQHRGQVLPRDLRGVRGQPRPRVGPGLGRRQVPQGGRGHVHRAARASSCRSPGLEPVAPRGGRPGGRGHGPGQAGPPGAADRRDAGGHGRAGRRLPGPVAPRPRRRRLRRPGGGGRDPQPLGPLGLPHRRHRPRGHQQPARLHHRPRGRPLARSTRPTWPRWSRRRSST